MQFDEFDIRLLEALQEDNQLSASRACGSSTAVAWILPPPHQTYA